MAGGGLHVLEAPSPVPDDDSDDLALQADDTPSYVPEDLALHGMADLHIAEPDDDDPPDVDAATPVTNVVAPVKDAAAPARKGRKKVRFAV
jgi:hypothetical protein